MLEHRYPAHREITPGARRPGIRLETDPAEATTVLADLLGGARSGLHETLAAKGFVVVPIAPDVQLQRVREPDVPYSFQRRVPISWHQDQGALLVLRAEHGNDNTGLPLTPTGLADADAILDGIRALLPHLRTKVGDLEPSQQGYGRNVEACMRELEAVLDGDTDSWARKWDTLLFSALGMLPQLREFVTSFMNDALRTRNALYLQPWDGSSVLIVDDRTMFHSCVETAGSTLGLMERLQIR